MLRRPWRALAAPVVAVVVASCLGIAARQPGTPAAERAELASRFQFSRTALNEEPPDARDVRRVQPALERISGWISAVGASAAVGDIAGTGRDGDVCLVDPRDDSVTVRPLPGSGGGYEPFTLTPAGTGLPWDPSTMAPMGCVTGDFAQHGRTGVLVFYWGRSPVLFLRRDGATTPTAEAFHATELVSPMQVWNTTTVNHTDIDGDGRPDILVGNYFPDGARVLDPKAADDPRMAMQDGMSNARNAGTAHVLRWTSGTAGPRPTAAFEDVPDALPADARHGWALALGAQDLTGDGRAELYFANDFGADRLLVNRSEPGRVRLTLAEGRRDVMTPKSKVLGRDSFKGMGVAFADLTGTGEPDILVSNITLPYALHESNFVFTKDGPSSDLLKGTAPYRDRSEDLGLSRSGWSWDVKTGDFDNNGSPEILQAVGFVKGHTNRWPELQELAMANDSALHSPHAWPDIVPGDDLSGAADNRFWVRNADGRYTDLAGETGLRQSVPSRSFALTDADGDGRLDIVVANQWGDSSYHRNLSPAAPHLTLRLRVPAATGDGTATTPAIGARVTLRTADGRVTAQQLQPANGHTGVNTTDLQFGLGTAGATAPVTAEISWRDADGQHRITRTFQPGRHTVVLTDPARTATTGPQS
ncbi:CRTAC1 family protein [Streptomyces sp. TRM64462]|uniref:CRTAC1 family protein n=1 Tax=Streptomyces sp. TRM64462 TaxID=2741726 RepID=UPI001585EC21|nr:CRTAC1 family protein [Streptomyces sp. TRM64462]